MKNVDDDNGDGGLNMMVITSTIMEEGTAIMMLLLQPF